MACLNYQKRIKLAENWLLNSGIQNQRGPHKGGFNAWYDITNKQYPFVYSEITGYGISSLLYLNTIKPFKTLVERACAAADWLTKKAFFKNKSVLCRYYYKTKQFTPRLCTFDAGVCLAALTNLYHQTKMKKYLKFSKKMADWLINEMQKEDGSFYARYLLDEKKLQDKGDKWSSQTGTFHAKVAIGLLHLGFLTGEPAYVESADKVCRWALKMQQNDGRFITNTKEGSTFLQPHCYALEGILCAGTFLRKKKYIDSAIYGLKWIMNHQLPTGGFPAYYIQSGKFLNDESADMSAQVVRLMLILSELGEQNIDINVVDKAMRRLLHFQCLKRYPKAHGGFLAGPAWFDRTEKDYGRQHVNSWVTMFVMQTLNMYLEKIEDHLEFNLFSIV